MHEQYLSVDTMWHLPATIACAYMSPALKVICAQDNAG